MGRLEEALRQYKHNHGRGGFVFAYDKYTVDAIFADLRKLVEKWRDEADDSKDHGIGGKWDCADEIDKLLEG